MHQFSNGETPEQRFDRISRTVIDFLNPIMVDENLGLIEELVEYGIDASAFWQKVEAKRLKFLNYCCAAKIYAKLFRNQFHRAVAFQRRALQTQVLDNCRDFARLAGLSLDNFISDEEVERLWLP